MPRIEYFDGKTLEVSIGMRRPPGPGVETTWYEQDDYRDNGFQPKTGILGESGRINLHIDPYLLTGDTVTAEVSVIGRLGWANLVSYEHMRNPAGSPTRRVYDFKLPQPALTPYVIDVGSNTFRLGFRWISKIDRNLYTVRGFIQAWSAHGERWEDYEDFTFDDGTYEHRLFVSPYDGDVTGKPSAVSYRLRVEAYFRNRTPVTSANVSFISQYAKPISDSLQPLGLYERFDRDFKSNLVGVRGTFWQEMAEQGAYTVRGVSGVEELGDEAILGDPWITLPGLPAINIPEIPNAVGNRVVDGYEQYLKIAHIASGGDHTQIEGMEDKNVLEAYFEVATEGVVEDPGILTSTVLAVNLAIPSLVGLAAYLPRQGGRILMNNVGNRMIEISENTTTAGGATDAMVALAVLSVFATPGLSGTILPKTDEKPGGGNAADTAFLIGNAAVSLSNTITTKEATDMVAGAAMFRSLRRIPGAKQLVGAGQGLSGIIDDAAGLQREGVTEEDITDDVIALTKEEMAAIQAEHEASRSNGIGALIGWLFPEDVAIRMLQHIGWENIYTPVEDYNGQS